MESRYNKHINKGESIIIDGDEFILKCSGNKNVAKAYFRLMKVFGSIKHKSKIGMNKEQVKEAEAEETQQMMASFDDNTTDAVLTLIGETLKASYPDEDETEQEAFGIKYMMVLMPVVMKLYAPAESNVAKETNKIEQFQQARTDGINNKQV